MYSHNDKTEDFLKKDAISLHAKEAYLPMINWDSILSSLNRMVHGKEAQKTVKDEEVDARAAPWPGPLSRASFVTIICSRPRPLPVHQTNFFQLAVRIESDAEYLNWRGREEIRRSTNPTASLPTFRGYFWLLSHLVPSDLFVYLNDLNTGRYKHADILSVSYIPGRHRGAK